ncbi:MAG: hypothetical protein M0Z36_06695 [Thermaerobacter sp.]|nr:hypothetical protein [Thermaerobacter sp.]
MTAVEYGLEKVIGGMLAITGEIGMLVGRLGLIQIGLPWVQTLYHTLFAVACTVFGVYLAYLITTRWILWNEGTADYDGTVLFKSIFRTMVYLAVSGSLVAVVYRFGIDLIGVITSTSLVAGVHAVGHWYSPLKTLANGGNQIGIVIIGFVVLVLSVVLLCVVFVEMLERSAELVIYYLAAPFVALGQLNPDGGAWSTWWKNLVILSLSSAVQWLCLEGMAGTTQVITRLQNLHGLAGITMHVLPVPLLLSMCLDIGWLIVGIRGPHLLREWSYRSGFASFGASYGGSAAKNVIAGTKS